MGRNNRSRKRKDTMNRVKRERNAKKELARLKKTLGIIDDANMKDALADISEVKTAEQIKKVFQTGCLNNIHSSNILILFSNCHSFAGETRARRTGIAGRNFGRSGQRRRH